MNFFHTGLHRVKRDPIMSNWKNKTTTKLHLDFIPFEQLDIRVLDKLVEGMNMLFPPFKIIDTIVVKKGFLEQHT